MVICYQINNPVRTIDCGSDAIIQIHSITAAHVTNIDECDLSDMMDKIATKKAEHKRSVNPSVG